MSKGFVYGTTQEAGDGGSVFKVSLTPGSTLTSVPSFAPADGHGPHSGLVNVGGEIIGITEEAGGLGFGTIFSVDPDTLAVNVLDNFDGATTGVYAYGLSLDGNSNIYGNSSVPNSPSTAFWKFGSDGLSFLAQPMGGTVNQALSTVTVAAATGSPVTLKLSDNAVVDLARSNPVGHRAERRGDLCQPFREQGRHIHACGKRWHRQRHQHPLYHQCRK